MFSSPISHSLNSCLRNFFLCCMSSNLVLSLCYVILNVPNLTVILSAAALFMPGNNLMHREQSFACILLWTTFLLATSSELKTLIPPFCLMLSIFYFKMLVISETQFSVCSRFSTTTILKSAARQSRSVILICSIFYPRLSLMQSSSFCFSLSIIKVM